MVALRGQGDDARRKSDNCRRATPTRRSRRRGEVAKGKAAEPLHVLYRERLAGRAGGGRGMSGLCDTELSLSRQRVLPSC